MVREDRVREMLEKVGAVAALRKQETKKENRKREDRDCLGGLRSPHTVVRRCPSLRKASGAIRMRMERLMKGDEEWI